MCVQCCFFFTPYLYNNTYELRCKIYTFMIKKKTWKKYVSSINVKERPRDDWFGPPNKPTHTYTHLNIYNIIDI